VKSLETDAEGQRRELLARLLRQRGLAADAAPAVPAHAGEAGAPLSSAQQGVWILERMGGCGAAYNVPWSLRLRGPLHERALADALTEVVRRHDALRMRISSAGGDPVQRAAPPGPVDLPVTDLARLPDAERAGAAERAIVEEARRPFDLERGPLLRARLLRTGEAEHVLLLVVHHVVFDGASARVLFGELGALYGASARGEPVCLPEPVVRYADYAAWRRASQAGDALDEQLAYWRKRLAGAQSGLELPADRPRPGAWSYRGARHRFALDPSLAERLRELARRERATPFMVLLAGLQVLLYRWSGQEEPLVGVPVAGRAGRGLEGVVGFFADTLVLRADLAGAPSFRELLARVRASALEDFARQEVPFERLVEATGAERSSARNPLFQVMLAYRGEPLPAPDFPGLEAELEEVETGTAKFDLLLSLADEGGAIGGALHYATDLFDAETAGRFVRHFQLLLEEAVSDPAARVSALRLQTVEEERRALAEWNDTARGHPRGECIHHLFAEQARRTPRAVALVHGGDSLDYAELDHRASRLARRLRAFGVGPEVRVGICVERSPEMVAALLGVLKAGGAYVPLDPEYPRERLAFMLEDSGASVLLAQDHLRDRLPALPGLSVLSPEGEPDAAGSAPEPEVDVDAANLAYLVYTSGSTGRSKGVAITHGSAAALLHWAREAFTPGELAGVLASTSICFDLSVFEIFAPLSWGGRVVLAANALELPRLPALADVTLVNTVPSAAAELLRQGAVPRGLPALCLAGEPLKPELARGLYERAGVAAVHNLYGPSEDTTYSTGTRVAPGSGRVTIGRPLPGTRAYLLDGEGTPVPVGIPGELYLGGAGLARGYLGRPELTAERFLPDPFSGEPGGRVYRTGDRARRLRDGELEFLGRVDHQVKLRGFRIEPGEVERALEGHPEVREAVVTVRDVPGDRLLAAYVVRAGSRTPPAAELRAFLRRSLPEHMVPSAFVPLEALPLTPNGKLDRAALPAPGGPADVEEHAAPRTPTEEVLAGIWAEVLGTDRIGVHDDFFALGGHSLRGTRVVSRAGEVFGTEVPLRALFDAPTVAALAERIDGLRGAGARPGGTIPRVRRDLALPLAFPQLRLWFLDRMLPDSPRYNMREALRIRGALRAEALEGAIRELARRHESLRTTFVADGSEPRQVVSPDPAVPTAFDDLRRFPEAEREAEVRRIAAEDIARPFDLARGPLLRARLLRTGAEEHVLIVTMHHIVSDGWSMGILVGEIGALYDALARGEPSPLPELPVQYADYAAWQRARLAGAELERQMEYWRGRLRGAATLLELPTDRPRPAVQGYEGAHRTFQLSPDTLGGLESLARREGCTLFMVMLAAFQTLLYRYTGQEDLLVGSPIANRTRPETEGLIGFFVNTLVLRGDLSGAPTFRELLRRVRETTLGAYAHQDLPFEKLVEELGTERSLSHEPLFQVMLALQNAPGKELRLGELRMERLLMERHTTKFDLTLFLWENEDGLFGWWEYATALFDEATIERMVGQFRELLDGVLADPERRADEMPLLPAAERAQLLAEWNDTSAPHDLPETLDRLFAERVRAHPDACALAFGAARLTYAELNRAANRLAHHLRGLGVGPDARVGICVERSPEMAVGLLAVVKAGGAAVALDPAYPAERIAFVVRDAGIAVLLTQRSLAGLLADAGAERVLLDGDREAIGRQPVDDPEPRALGDNLLYVIYTSGSTGTPKGVGVTHRAFLNLLGWQRGHPVLGSRARTAQFATFGFCVSFQEMFGTWDLGGDVVVVEEDVRRDFERLMQLVREHGVERLYLPFAALKHLAELPLGDARRPLSLRQVITAGEPLQVNDHLRAFFAGLGGCSLHNQYGASETHVVSSLCLEDGPQGWPAVPTVGRPVANTRLYVLDRALQPVPAGVTGELYVGGASLPRGYLGDPGLTAAKLVPDPFGGEPGGRLYRTGDAARFRPGGNVEVLGRGDHQVKIRGYRIELGEIEAVLRRSPSVRDVALMVHAPRPGAPRLVAYVVPAGGDDGSLQGLRGELRRSLPEYMIPSVFVPLQRLPVNANGKLDHAALPVPALAELEGSAEFVAPRTPTEAEVASVWASVLAVERVGARDHFFDLGGHSLLATRVITRLREAFRVEVPLRTLFEAPTVERFAEELDRLRGAGDAAPARPRVSRASRAAYRVPRAGS
jgi:amino acid adenylation domain-containing protein